MPHWDYVVKRMTSAELDNFTTEDGLMQYYKRQDIDFKIINKIMKKFLSRENYELIIMYYFYNLRQYELAEAFGITQGAVSQRLKRIKLKIRKIILKSGIYNI